MIRTKNLHLPVLENTDSVTNIYTQANDISETLENEIGGYLDDMEELPEMRTDLTELQNTVSNLSARTDLNVTSINNVSTRVSKIEQGRSSYVNENNETVYGIITRYIVDTVATGTNDIIPLDESHKFVEIEGGVSIDLYEKLGITSMAGKHIVNAVCYTNTYMGLNPNFVLSGVYKYPTQNNFKLNFSANATKYVGINQQVPSYQDVAVRVIFDLFVEGELPE